MRFIFAIVATALLAAAPAFAADEGGFYVGAGFGSLGIDTDVSGGDAGDLKFSGDDTSFKLIGGYEFMKYFAAEVEYIDGGSAEDTYKDADGSKLAVNIDLTGWNLSVMGAWPFTDQFKVFGKLGMIFWDGDLGMKATGPVCDILVGEGLSCSEKDSDSDSDFSWGLGASWFFTPNIGLRAEYQGFEIQDTDTVDLISASVVWKF